MKIAQHREHLREITFRFSSFALPERLNQVSNSVTDKFTSISRMEFRSKCSTLFITYLPFKILPSVFQISENSTPAISHWRLRQLLFCSSSVFDCSNVGCARSLFIDYAPLMLITNYISNRHKLSSRSYLFPIFYFQSAILLTLDSCKSTPNHG